MVRATAEITIARPAAEVFAFLADVENNPRWQGGMRSCRWTSADQPQVGSTYEQRASFLGRPIDSTFEVVALQPGRSITIITIESTFPITVTRSVEPRGDDRCVVRADVRGEPSGVLRLAAPLVGWLVQRSVRADYHRLKALLER